MQIDRSDPDDELRDAKIPRSVRPTLDNSLAVGKGKGSGVTDDNPSDSSLACPDSVLRKERAANYQVKVQAVYRRPGIDHDHAQGGHDGRVRNHADTGDAGREIHPAARSRDGYAAFDANEGVRVLPHNRWDGGDFPDDPRNRSNLRTGRFDASWSTYDRALAAARERTGGGFGQDSIKMYDRSPETGEGTGTLIGEQTPDRLRGWRIDGQDGHVNWWDWTGGKKGGGGRYGHDWFPADPSTPGSRYIGWAPWQDMDGNIL